jgi:hypothetical protein
MKNEREAEGRVLEELHRWSQAPWDRRPTGQQQTRTEQNTHRRSLRRARRCSNHGQEFCGWCALGPPCCRRRQPARPTTGPPPRPATPPRPRGTARTPRRTRRPAAARRCRAASPGRDTRTPRCLHMAQAATRPSQQMAVTGAGVVGPEVLGAAHLRTRSSARSRSRCRPGTRGRGRARSSTARSCPPCAPARALCRAGRSTRRPPYIAPHAQMMPAADAPHSSSGE